MLSVSFVTTLVGAMGLSIFMLAKLTPGI